MPGFPVQIKKMEVLGLGEIEAIREAAFDVMATTGVMVGGEEAHRLLEDAGCHVDRERSMVRFPREVVETALAVTPRSFVLKAQDESNSLEIGKDDHLYFFSSCGLHTVDLDTWEQREPTRKEFHDFVRVLDSLPNVDGIAPFIWWGFARVPQAMRLLESNAAKLRLSTKAQGEGAVLGNDTWNVEMARAVGQDLWNLVNPVAPLAIPEEESAKIIRLARADMPFSVTAGPTLGATAPATLAGGLVSNAAEHLAALVLAQVVRPGTRFISGHMAHAQNMTNGSPFFGQVTNALQAAGFNQLWDLLGVPTYNTCSTWTGSKSIDYQAGYETALAATIAAASGASLLPMQGGMTAQLAASPVKAIIDDDVAGMIGRFLQGIEVTGDTLAVDLIKQVGPMPGTYLGEAHTREWWRKEQYRPVVADHSSYEEWATSGKKVALDHAREKMDALVASHPGTRLSASQEEAVESILQEARAHYRKTGLITEEEWAVYQEDLNSDEYPYA
ncbi:MAG: trimethylamine methyltransferase family protein [Thermoleophilia bacterium]|nr:trimethylamine methyltransferase family protein [Thermoleophilia bacterium]